MNLRLMLVNLSCLYIVLLFSQNTYLEQKIEVFVSRVEGRWQACVVAILNLIHVVMLSKIVYNERVSVIF